MNPTIHVEKKIIQTYSNTVKKMQRNSDLECVLAG